MNVREVARILEISVSLTYRLIATGRLGCSRHGMGRGVIRVSEEQVSEYLASTERGRGLPPSRPAAARPRLRHLRL